jgi:hypothetical protein
MHRLILKYSGFYITKQLHGINGRDFERPLKVTISHSLYVLGMKENKKLVEEREGGESIYIYFLAGSLKFFSFFSFIGIYLDQLTFPY